MKIETLRELELSDLKGKLVLQEELAKGSFTWKTREKICGFEIADRGGYHCDPAEIASCSPESALRRIHKKGALNPTFCRAQCAGRARERETPGIPPHA